MNTISETDWSRIDAMTDEDIDTSDIPPLSLLTVVVRTDPETLAWFQSQGEMAEQQMSMALRIYAESNKMYSDYSKKAA